MVKNIIIVCDCGYWFKITVLCAQMEAKAQFGAGGKGVDRIYVT